MLVGFVEGTKEERAYSKHETMRRLSKLFLGLDASGSALLRSAAVDWPTSMTGQ